MNIVFASKRLEKICNDERLRVRTYGKVQAERLGRRLDDLKAADRLEDLRHVPGRLHELHGDRAGQLSLDLEHPNRLIFVPANNPVPRKDDGGLDWTRITTVQIQGIEDTHE